MCVCRAFGHQETDWVDGRRGYMVHGLTSPCEEARSWAQGGEVSSSSSVFLLYNDMTVCFHCGTVFLVDEVNPSCFTGPDVWRERL